MRLDGVKGQFVTPVCTLDWKMDSYFVLPLSLTLKLKIKRCPLLLTSAAV